jgi:hypothetical protein
MESYLLGMAISLGADLFVLLEIVLAHHFHGTVFIRMGMIATTHGMLTNRNTDIYGCKTAHLNVLSLSSLSEIGHWDSKCTQTVDWVPCTGLQTVGWVPCTGLQAPIRGLHSSLVRGGFVRLCNDKSWGFSTVSPLGSVL